MLRTPTGGTSTSQSSSEANLEIWEAITQSVLWIYFKSEMQPIRLLTNGHNCCCHSNRNLGSHFSHLFGVAAGVLECGHLSKRNIDDSATLLNTGTSLFNSLDVGVWEDFLFHQFMIVWIRCGHTFALQQLFTRITPPTQVFYAPYTCMHTAILFPSILAVVFTLKTQPYVSSYASACSKSYFDQVSFLLLSTAYKKNDCDPNVL